MGISNRRNPKTAYSGEGNWKPKVVGENNAITQPSHKFLDTPLSKCVFTKDETGDNFLAVECMRMVNLSCVLSLYVRCCYFAIAFLFMLPLRIFWTPIRWRHYVFNLSVRPSVRACVLMCVPGRDILRLTSTSSLDIFVVFNFYLVYDVIVN